MLTHNLGYPRIGKHRELKKAIENYWINKISLKELFNIGKKLRKDHWIIQSKLDIIPCNDFSFYDQVLDMTILLGAIPNRYINLYDSVNFIDFYFSMARGYQTNKIDITAMEMTKWFDTNYHYIVPEFTKNQNFKLNTTKIFNEFQEAKEILNKIPKPVFIGPVSYLLLGKEKEKNFDRIDLIDNILPIYIELFKKLQQKNVEWIQLDEPFLMLNLNNKEKQIFKKSYKYIVTKCPNLKILLTTYFESSNKNFSLALELPTTALHIDISNSYYQFDELLKQIPKNRILSLGVINGRNIWKNNYDISLQYIKKAIKYLGENRIMIAPSCSLLHVPFDVNLENKIYPEIKNYMSFAHQKIQEIQELNLIYHGNKTLLQKNKNLYKNFKNSILVNDKFVKQRIISVSNKDICRKHSFKHRRKLQNQLFKFPLFPTTTIGSFPQTNKIRQLRVLLKNGTLTEEKYNKKIKNLIIDVIQQQENIGLDVLVHGEFERSDMVEYFGEQLKGFLSTKNGWIQSYGSRCVKPPIIYGDISRLKPITVDWICFAQNQTKKPVKGILTGPLTILQWSFVRDDQDRSLTAQQIALAIRDEVLDLERAGIKIIQIDEPALREGVPLRKENWNNYFKWSINAFKIASSGVQDDTQIHTHMCYSEFNEIMEHIASMDADVLTIETSRSQMELLVSFSNFKYPNEIGPGVYDFHSPRIPNVKEIKNLLTQAIKFLPYQNIWVNPDCGLKTRKWPETIKSLINMVNAAKKMRHNKKIYQ